MAKQKTDSTGWLSLAVLTVIMLWALYFVAGSWIGLNCYPAWFSEDKYCGVTYVDIFGQQTNFSDSIPVHFIGSHAADLAAQEDAQRRALAAQEREQRRQDCYNNGTDYAAKFTIIEDYNLTCPKMAYINDHLIDSIHREDGGYISGSYSGFLSHGHIKGRMYQYVVTGIVATGQLPKSVKYRTICDKSTVDEQIEYYTESDFVMTYVNSCIGSEGK